VIEGRRVGGNARAQLSPEPGMQAKMGMQKPPGAKPRERIQQVQGNSSGSKLHNRQSQSITQREKNRSSLKKKRRGGVISGGGKIQSMCSVDVEEVWWGKKKKGLEEDRTRETRLIRKRLLKSHKPGSPRETGLHETLAGGE